MKTGLKTASLLIVLSGVSAWAQAPAPTPAPQKIAVLNMQEALVNTVDGKKAIAELRAKFGPRDQDFQKRSQDLQAMQDQYRKTQATLSDEQKAKMERDMDSKTKALQRDTDDAKQDMDADEQRVMQSLGGKIMQVITRYAVDNQYSMVFDDSGQPNNILFASTATDITRDIIALYDKSAPTTTSAAPPPGPRPVPAPVKPTTIPVAKPPVAKQP